MNQNAQEATLTSLEQHVGRRLRDRRLVLKLSQTELASQLGISYQQLQKYENGTSALTLGRLLQLSTIMNVPPSFFYDGVPTNVEGGTLIESEVIQSERTRPLQILLVEDSSSDEILFRNAVEQCGAYCEIHTLQNPEIVIDYLHNHESKYGRPRPDLIILDINLPRLNGLQLLKEIKAQEEMANIPVMVLTNSVRVKEMKEAYSLNACGFIQKSLKYEDFCDDVAAAMTYWSRAVVLPAM